jgi:uncharacterized membrane protein
MADPRQNERLQRAVHWTLLGGVALSGSLMLVGLAVALLGAQPRPHNMPPGLVALLRTSLSGNGASMIELALLVLMATPVMRVAVLGIGWAMSGTRRFAVVALAVLALLGFSIFLGIG